VSGGGMVTFVTGLEIWGVRSQPAKLGMSNLQR